MAQDTSGFSSHFHSFFSDAASTATADHDLGDDALANLEKQLENSKPLTNEDVLKLLQTEWQGLDTGEELPQATSAGTSATTTKTTPTLNWLQSVIPSSVPLDSVTSLLASANRSDDEISSELLDLLGFEAIDSIPQILSKRSDIRSEADRNTSSVAAGLNGLTLHDDTTATSTPAESDSDAPLPRAMQDGRRSKKQRGRQRGGEGKPKEMKFSLHAGMTIDELERMHLQKLEEASNRPHINNNNGYVVQEQIKYPHVYNNQSATGSAPSFGSKVMLPLGTARVEHEHYTEVTIPTPPKHPSAYTAVLLPISTLPPLLQRSFPYQTLNRLQSIVYPTAYETSENMLVCAPTGAGKTDVAVLTVLRAISMYADVRVSDGKMRNKDWKVVYVAPMKALASEIVRKMKKRFEWCGLAVRELTGDMQLTRQEIAETQMIVTTPEKWDVVTRKTTSEGELASRLRLLIIDEVHLLHEDRGAVLESIVARTLRQVESSQTLIRIVGLSATLPNYVDVADFLRVNPYVGLFFFDISFRPVPLEQHFIAAKGKAGGTQSKENMDHATFDKALDLVKDGHQVLIFVHARKDTVKTGQMIREKAVDEGEMEWFDTRDNPKLDMFKRELQMSRNREMKELVEIGIGIHHAGMLRSDRNLSERLFENNVTKILVCTATLAWGVNLPAYAVIIKGTQLYDSSKGAFKDLSVLDVLQMFGRAGRPQYETHGVSYICTTSDKVDHYITAVNQQVPIESKFIEGLVDSLNAEIALGTVTTVDEGVRWLGYTFLQVRMRKNPMVYGISASDLFSDPALGNRRRELITNASKILQRNGMVQYDADLETLATTEQGQIASKYYLRTTSIETFNSIFKPKMTEADLLSVLSKSAEFQQVAVRESETDELQRLIENVIPCQVKGGTDSSDGKANVLLQAYICKASLEDFALISDMEYVAQNAARIARALLEIGMSRKWSQATASLLSICKSIEKRLWPWSHPLQQMSIPAELMYNINRWVEDMAVEEMALMDPAEFGKMIRQNERLGGIAVTTAQQFPRVSVQHALQPLSHDLLRVRLKVSRDFKWSEKLHGRAQYFWVWLSDAEDRDILQISKSIIREATTQVPIDFTILLATLPSELHIRTMSDNWLGSESITELAMSSLILPPKPPLPRRLLDLPYQSDKFDPDLLELIHSRSSILSTFELQCLHTLFFSNANAVVAAPISDARYQLLTVPIWRLIKRKPSSISLVTSPDLVSAKQLHTFLQQDLKFAIKRHKISVQLATKPATCIAAIQTAAQGTHTIIIITPKTLGQSTQSSSGSKTTTPSIDLLVADDLNNLSAEYELLLSSLLPASKNHLRVAGFSASLLDSSSLAAWLKVDAAHTYAFHSSSRPSPIITSTTPFNIPHSPSLLKAMVKPVFDAMRNNPGNSICFVPHRAQCYATMTDLLTHSATDMNKFVEMDEDTLSQYTARVADPKIAEGLLHGFAVLSEGAHPTDQAIAKHLFQTGAVRVLIVPREACHTLDVTASLVIAMSTQYATVQPDTGERTILDYPLNDLLQMQTKAAGTAQEQTGQFSIFTQPDNASLISRFLSEGLPLESNLYGSDTLFRALLSRVVAGSISTRQACLDALATTFMSQRMAVNPAYYDCQEGSQAVKLSRMVDDMLESWRQQLLIRTKNADSFKATFFGEQVMTRRITQSQIENLWSCTEGHAVKLVGSSKQAAAASSEDIEAFLKRLPKSLQRRIRPENVEEQVSASKSLVVTFLAKKLAPEGSELEKIQGGLAIELLERLMRSRSS